MPMPPPLYLDTGLLMHRPFPDASSPLPILLPHPPPSCSYFTSPKFSPPLPPTPTLPLSPQRAYNYSFHSQYYLTLAPKFPPTLNPKSSPTLSPKYSLILALSHSPAFSITPISSRTIAQSSPDLNPSYYPNIYLKLSPTLSLDADQMPSLLLSLLVNTNFT